MSTPNVKPGVKTTEFYALIGVVGTALTTALQSDEISVKIACVVCLTLVTCTYMFARMLIKKKDPG